MDLVTVLNTIRSNASATYQDRIPEATRTNIEDIRFAMIGDDNIAVANEFMATLLNKLVKSVVHNKRFSNPLKGLKKGKKPLGDAVEEIYNNFLKGQAFNANSGAAMMERNLPDTKTLYHRTNYKQMYKVTVSREILSKAFASYDALESYITNLIDQLYNSAELDEFINMKQLLKAAYDANALKIVKIADPLLSEANGRELLKNVKTVSGLMQFPSSDWNGYLTAQTTDTKPIITFSRKNEQILLIDTATDTSVAVDVLASIFNMSVADFNDAKKIVIDVFPIEGARAALLDEAFFQIWDDLFTVASWRNPESLYDNYYLHVHQTMAYSILVNAVLFEVGATT